ARVVVKAECVRRGGAFKFRGAYNKISRLAGSCRGVTAYSSGNHAQAVALAAATVGLPATILMPADAPEAKVEATRGYGAEVVTYDRYTEDRERLGQALAAGCATVVKALAPHVRVVGVEPEAADDTRGSLERGERVEIPVPATIAGGP